MATKLHPHQLRALTFLLSREQEFACRGAKNMSLWQERINPLSQELSWVNIVTQVEEFKKPSEAKSAILADDVRQSKKKLNFGLIISCALQMGLGKTITCVSLIATTLNAARAFAESPMTPPPTPPPGIAGAPLTASHFQGTVWGIPPPSIEPSGSSSAKAKGKAAREQDRVEAQYTRACRIKMKSRATLIICPLSTVVNWEDQFKEHWKGEVTVFGGAAAGANSCASTPAPSSISELSTPTGSQLDMSFTPTPAVTGKSANGRVREGTPLRVYVYHGNARRLDPDFLADFDAVITTYSTLASEFSKQTKSLEAGDDDDDEEGVSSEGFIEIDSSGQPIVRSKAKKPKKRKKIAVAGVEVTSPLQSIHWFRVVLDEAQ